MDAMLAAVRGILSLMLYIEGPVYFLAILVGTKEAENRAIGEKPTVRSCFAVFS